MKKLTLFVALGLSTILSVAYSQPFWEGIPDPCLYASTSGMGVAKNGYVIQAGCNPFRYSTNGGLSWNSSTGGTGGATKFVVTADGTIYGNALDFLKSTNNGMSWSSACSSNFKDFAINSNGHIFGLLNGYLLKSIDQGMTWDTINTSYIDPTYPACTIGITSSNTIFIGTGYPGIGGKIYYSTDNGVNFTPTTGTTPSSISVYKIRIFNNDIYVGTQGSGLYRSTNNGVTWTSICPVIADSPNPWVNDIIFNSSGVVFLVLDYWGIFYSSNKGNTWTDISIGLRTSGNTYRTPTAITISPSGILYCGTNDFGTYRSKSAYADIKETAAENDAITVFPNPAKDKITLVISTNTIPANCSVSIINTAGTTVKQLAIQATSTDINVQNLPQGNYIYQVQSDMGILKTGKIIIE